ncbi:hypothetical protein BCR34DRAFT_584016 [Clohesyomyces aquaticus]|uniref:Potassium channel tetramerisation-type BTB domain-containing protein n=1 Tax=Clohesyomyces aquaticus TaxID=1231657 RepID=A0A1Y2A378_9PLEO|nr:hypothetical protein BCR34DRAFT_584016 [Clohesyomyces aquaticus]
MSTSEESQEKPILMTPNEGVPVDPIANLSVDGGTNTGHAEPVTTVNPPSILGSSSSPPPKPKFVFPDIITLDVGGRTFRTRRSNLESGSNILSAQAARWQQDLEQGKPFFVDTDPDLFVHILRFLRRENVYPLFWKKEMGFDYALYNELWAEADYFGMVELANWIKEKKYLKAITMNLRSPKAHEGGSTWSETTGPNVEVHQERVIRRRLEYVCPRGIFEHCVEKGETAGCGEKCRKAGAGRDDEYREREIVVDVVTWEKETIFDVNACVADLKYQK